jgi:lipopolysaccharide transport system permease protein
VVPSRYRLLFSLNPMVGIIDGFRWSLLGAHVSGQWVGLAVAVAVVGVLLTTGIWYFRKTERTFADVI